MEIREINFAVANICNADCVFCPRSFVKVPVEDRYMPVSLVEKVLSEVTTPEFQRQHPVCHSVLSENGEPFLNPDILDILRATRRAGLGISLFSNFALMGESIAETVLRENLVDAIHVNIDGATEESYRAVKKLPLDVVSANLGRFLSIRDVMKSPVRICIHAMPYKNYHDSVVASYGSAPGKGNGLVPPFDAHLVVAAWGNRLRAGDFIGVDNALLWAERYGKEARSGDFKCPNIQRVRHCAYINPTGDWYACCYDMGNELVLGNVNRRSVLEIANSKARRVLVDSLESGRFEEIGFPCTRVDACQTVAVQ
ncbi:MAG: radical SAM/SPASM domain-containing protein [Candidatus Peribacteraceae bacterium]|jgi:sulfatase maturation enzyme AslB (radical SAM superfamily)